jgi:hypothetical protein
MLQMNYLLPLAGRTSDSFVTNDLMRLPLGILTGVGFIGGGAILNIMSVEQHASLAIALHRSGLKEDEIRGQLAAAAISVRKISVRRGSGVRTLTLNVSQSRRRSEPAVPAIVEELTRRDGVVALQWRHLD